MKKRITAIAVLTVLLVVVAGGYLALSSATVRAVDFLSILAIGALSGLLVQQLAG